MKISFLYRNQISLGNKPLIFINITFEFPNKNVFYYKYYFSCLLLDLFYKISFFSL